MSSWLSYNANSIQFNFEFPHSLRVSTFFKSPSLKLRLKRKLSTIASCNIKTQDTQLIDNSRGYTIPARKEKQEENRENENKVKPTPIL